MGVVAWYVTVLSTSMQAEVNREVVALEDVLKATEKLDGVEASDLALAQEVKDQANKVLQVSAMSLCVSYHSVFFVLFCPPEACGWTVHSSARGHSGQVHFCPCGVHRGQDDDAYF